MKAGKNCEKRNLGFKINCAERNDYMDKKEKQVKPMECPVCHKFYFTKLTEDELEDGETPNEQQCSSCGWYYDLEQFKDPDLENESNKMSLNQYKEWYHTQIKKNHRWNYSRANRPAPKPHKCPVCNEYTFKDSICHHICPVCGWEDSGFEEFPDEKMSISSMSFHQRKEWFAKQREQNPKFRVVPLGRPKGSKNKKGSKNSK